MKRKSRESIKFKRADGGGISVFESLEGSLGARDRKFKVGPAFTLTLYRECYEKLFHVMIKWILESI